MKFIQKQRQPQELIAWLRAPIQPDDGGAPTAWSYDDMPAPVRSAVLASLVREQGGLCCYTGRRIDVQSAHIEHLKPQALCVNHEDTEYVNLLAAFPAPNVPVQCKYGAHAKKDWYDELRFVHPLRQECERRFRFRTNGKITPADNTDAAATETIRQLALDHSELVGLRKTAIDEALFDVKLSRAQIIRLRDAMNERDGNGLFRPFCFAVRQACEKLLKRSDK